MVVVADIRISTPFTAGSFSSAIANFRARNITAEYAEIRREVNRVSLSALPCALSG
ncbi:MAG: hypothetical protein U9N43_08075 [Euryarchaeota archaeon]|nr:hypothetical protein [Euryarchaeota archaeon]